MKGQVSIIWVIGIEGKIIVTKTKVTIKKGTKTTINVVCAASCGFSFALKPQWCKRVYLVAYCCALGQYKPL